MKKYLYVLLILIIFPFGTHSANKYEEIHDLKASDQLPAQILKTDFYNIKPIVRSNGFMNIYSVESDFGDYEVVGNLSLLVLLRELWALEELRNLSKTKVFAEAAANSAAGSVEAMFHIATNPVSTIKGVPGGVGRLFSRTKKTGESVYRGTKSAAGSAVGSVTGGGDEEKENEGEKSSLTETTTQTTAQAADWYFGISGAQRNWARKLGVDPYTRNEMLQNALREVAKIDRAGSFTVRFIPIPSIPGSRYVGLATDAIWNLSYEELLELNIKTMQEIGISEESINNLLANDSFSPSLRTLLIAAVLELEEVKNRNVLIELAATKDTVDFARFYLETVILMTWYHSQKFKITEIRSYGETPYSIDEKNRLVLLMPVDYLFWTKEVAGLAKDLTNNIKAEDQSERDAIFLGDISDLSEEGMNNLGWDVQDELNESTKRFRDRYLEVIE